MACSDACAINLSSGRHAGNLAVQETIGQQASTFPGLVTLLTGLDSTLQCAAACAVATLCSMARSNAGRFLACTGASLGLLRLLPSTDTRAAGAAAAALVYLGRSGPDGQHMLEQHAAAVCAALKHLRHPGNRPGHHSALLVVQALQGSAAASTGFGQAMQESPGALSFLRKLHGSSDIQTCSAAAAALELVRPGEGADMQLGCSRVQCNMQKGTVTPSCWTMYLVVVCAKSCCNQIQLLAVQAFVILVCAQHR